MVPLSELSEQQRDQAQRRFEVLRPHLEDGVALLDAAAAAGIPARTARCWLARFRADDLTPRPAPTAPPPPPTSQPAAPAPRLRGYRED